MSIAAQTPLDRAATISKMSVPLLSLAAEQDASLQQLAHNFAVDYVPSSQAADFLQTKPCWWLQLAPLEADKHSLALSLQHASQWKKPLQIDFITRLAHGKSQVGSGLPHAQKKTLNPVHINPAHINPGHINPGQGRKSPLARAVGVKRGQEIPRVCDACAGLGRDALQLAKLGCDVTLVERNPQMALLLDDALRRLAQYDQACAGRMRLVHADAYQYLTAAPAHTFSAIYLDPMFPVAEHRSAQVKREMQVLRAFLSQDATLTPAVALAELARQRCRRVVIKRAKRSAGLLAATPELRFKSSSMRYDVYFNPQQHAG